MTEQEVRDVIKACGWSYLLRRRKERYWYVYAARTVKGQRLERYIGSRASLERLTEEELKQKLSCT